jgi:hypothetical protein
MQRYSASTKQQAPARDGNRQAVISMLPHFLQLKEKAFTLPGHLAKERERGRRSYKA